MTSKPTILIGIGSSGLYVLEQLQNFSYENLGQNKPGDHVEYIYIETNKDNRPNDTALPNEIKRIYLDLNGMDTMVRELKAQGRGNLDWLPPEDHVLEAGLGAGGVPSCGRLALWGRNSDTGLANWENVKDGIQNSFSNVSGHSSQSSDGSLPAVFIVGSLTGGTGSGIFIDLAYLIRDLIPGIQEIFSLLLLPPEDLSSKTGSDILFLNTYGSLMSLNHINKAENRYIRPNDIYGENLNPPFEYNQFISQSYSNANPPLSSLTALYKIAGLYLFLNTIGLRAKRMERLIDAKGNYQIGQYGTFGLSGIQYPKAQIQEHLGLSLGTQLLKRWIDKSNFWQGGQQFPINENRIGQQVTQVFDRIIRDAFDSINTVSGVSLDQRIYEEAVAINRGEKGDKETYLLGLFSPSNADGFYGFVGNNMPIASDSIIEAIQNYIVAEFNQHQNLFYTRFQLKSFADAIQKVLDYWKELGVSSFPTRWEELVRRKQIPWMLSDRRTYLGEQNKVLAERMKVTSDLLKMHHFVTRLFDIRKNIRDGQTALVTTLGGAGRVELPIISQIDKLIEQIRLTIGSKEENERGRNMSFQRRRLEIEADLADTTLPIKRIYPAKTFEQEAKQAMERYRNIRGRNFSNETVIGASDLWNYLNQGDTSELHTKLYHDCIINYKDEMVESGAVEDYDVSEFVRKHPEEARIMAERAVGFMLPIRGKTLETSRNIPRVVIGAQKEVTERVIKQLRDQNFNQFNQAGDHILEIQELKNIMVFYIERGNFDPTADINYFKRVKKVYDEYPSLKKISKDTFNKMRMPYLH